MAELQRPDVRWHASFLSAMQEFRDEGRARPGSMLGEDLLEHGPTWSTPAGFAAYVAQVRREAVAPRDDFVPHTTWWWIDGGEYIGRIDLRHRLTERLREVGGHVGYDVRRSRRREGHATAMLAAVLPHARARGIADALLTCDVGNLASRRVIEANGGRLEDRRGAKLRFLVGTGQVTSPSGRPPWAAAHEDYGEGGTCHGLPSPPGGGGPAVRGAARSWRPGEGRGTGPGVGGWPGRTHRPESTP
ncbi:GNAT family N-acetyltransferase [Nocardioides aurantiacus]|uniref:Putative acetyltransferase n=1 Tax=Nocardioides aurantiacus TaxID=86796 RepID=A0A3N2CVT5_9ACTN|nr:GNAT family N-acetyltransferase [Nocardioides aurantiacus]ROR91599.1 putative acetyltransferase [Nocardioides aurantiacus]